MACIDTITNGYGYPTNKGYGTKAQREGIDLHGLTRLRCMSFVTNKRAAEVSLSIPFETNSVEESMI